MKQKREKEHPASWREQIRQAVTEMDVPAYAFMDVPRIEMTGSGRLLMERHHGIVEYGEQRIRIAARGMTVCITGRRLQLQAMTHGEISVTGDIEAVQLNKEEGKEC